MLHRAGTQEVDVDRLAERLLGEAQVVPEHLRLAELGEPGRLRAAQAGGDLRDAVADGGGELRLHLRDDDPPLPVARKLEDDRLVPAGLVERSQLHLLAHAITSEREATSRSTSPFVWISVVQ